RRSHTHSSVPEGQHTRITPPEPGRSSRKPQDKALPPVPTGICATEPVKSNQGCVLGWEIRILHTVVCVCALASFCVFASGGRRGQARDGTGLGSSWRWIGREGNTKNESVRCTPDPAQAQTRQYKQSREHPLERIENGPISGGGGGGTRQARVVNCR
ncbi:unnamed protein product, partial [Ectocarpus sp. 4 AP-2014]